VLTIQSFEDEDEAVRLANSTLYGLSAIIYTSSEARAERLGTALRAGTIWVNCFLVRDSRAPSAAPVSAESAARAATTRSTSIRTSRHCR